MRNSYFVPQLVRCSRQIYKEGIPILYGKNEIEIDQQLVFWKSTHQVKRDPFALSQIQDLSVSFEAFNIMNGSGIREKLADFFSQCSRLRALHIMAYSFFEVDAFWLLYTALNGYSRARKERLPELWLFLWIGNFEDVTPLDVPVYPSRSLVREISGLSTFPLLRLSSLKHIAFSLEATEDFVDYLEWFSIRDWFFVTLEDSEATTEDPRHMMLEWVKYDPALDSCSEVK